MPSNINVLIMGCSFARGHGLDLEKEDDRLWANRLFDNNHTITNLSKSGLNNNSIFLETMSELVRQDYDKVLVSWTSIPRYNYNIGLELYGTNTMLKNIDVGINPNRTISGKWLEEIGNRLRSLHNDHWDILDVVKYVNILVNHQVNIKKGQIFFVNALAPWCNNYFEKVEFDLPSDLDIYCRRMLQSSTRSDTEVKEIYEMIHAQYEYYGGIQEKHWLNLYHSLHSLQVDDAAPDDPHPGYRSQDIFVDYLSYTLNEKMR